MASTDDMRPVSAGNMKEKFASITATDNQAEYYVNGAITFTANVIDQKQLSCKCDDVAHVYSADAIYWPSRAEVVSPGDTIITVQEGFEPSEDPGTIEITVRASSGGSAGDRTMPLVWDGTAFVVGSAWAGATYKCDYIKKLQFTYKCKATKTLPTGGEFVTLRQLKQIIN